MTSDRRQTSLLRLVGTAALVGLVLLGAAILVSQRASAQAPSQPIAFRHQLHSEAGIQCLFCHPNALRSDVAGIPSVQRCMGCHQTIATESPEIQVLTAYWERQEPIPWQRVMRLPDFVYFSHQPHLGAGINCETCHGDVG
ncbi:MAG: cytochrome c3 family protein [Candidatus Bipolaricaulota bacterium]